MQFVYVPIGVPTFDLEIAGEQFRLSALFADRLQGLPGCLFVRLIIDDNGISRLGETKGHCPAYSSATAGNECVHKN